MFLTHVSIFLFDRCGFYGGTPNIKIGHKDVALLYQLYDNMFNKITPTINFSKNFPAQLQDNCFSTPEITTFIKNLRDYYTINAPINQDRTIQIHNPIVNLKYLNGTITGGELNDDLIALKAFWTANGKTLTVLYNDSSYTNTAFTDKAKVAFSFDDSFKSDLAMVYPLFHSHGLLGTSFCYTFPHTEWHLSPEEKILLDSLGWDIQDHTSFPSPNPTEQQVRDAYDAGIAFKIANNIPESEHTAYNGGYNTATSRGVTAEYYQSGRAINNLTGNYNFKETDRYLIGAFFADFTNEAQVDAIKIKIDYAISRKCAVVIYAHNMEENHGIPLEPNWTLFKKLFDYIRSKDVEIVTYSQLITALNNL